MSAGVRARPVRPACPYGVFAPLQCMSTGNLFCCERRNSSATSRILRLPLTRLWARILGCAWLAGQYNVPTEAFSKGPLMRFLVRATLITASFVLTPHFMAHGQTEGSRSVEGGGISVSGWTGAVDPSEQSQRQSVKDAKLSKDGADLHVTTGPA